MSLAVHLLLASRYLEMCGNNVSAHAQVFVTWLADVGAQCVHNAVQEFGSANLL